MLHNWGKSAREGYMSLLWCSWPTCACVWPPRAYLSLRKQDIYCAKLCAMGHKSHPSVRKTGKIASDKVNLILDAFPLSSICLFLFLCSNAKNSSIVFGTTVSHRLLSIDLFHRLFAICWTENQESIIINVQTYAKTTKTKKRNSDSFISVPQCWISKPILRELMLSYVRSRGSTLLKTRESSRNLSHQKPTAHF